MKNSQRLAIIMIASRFALKALKYACQIGSKCRKIVFIYSNTICMSKLQYIRVNCNVYVHSLQNICASQCMEFRFILPRFNVIFDIYTSTYIGVQTYANELTRIPRRIREWY